MLTRADLAMLRLLVRERVGQAEREGDQESAVEVCRLPAVVEAEQWQSWVDDLKRPRLIYRGHKWGATNRSLGRS